MGEGGTVTDSLLEKRLLGDFPSHDAVDLRGARRKCKIENGKWRMSLRNRNGCSTGRACRPATAGFVSKPGWGNRWNCQTNDNSAAPSSESGPPGGRTLPAIRTLHTASNFTFFIFNFSFSHAFVTISLMVIFNFPFDVDRLRLLAGGRSVFAYSARNAPSFAFWKNLVW